MFVPSDRFWELIDSARLDRNPRGASADADRLKELLSALPTPEVVTFAGEFRRALVQLNHWDVWAVGFILAGGMSDDHFHYFRSWIIGKGKTVYEAALRNPDSISQYVTEDDIEESELDNELLEYAASDVFEEREVPDPADESDLFPDDEPAGEGFNEDDVESRFPLTAARVSDDSS